MLTPEQLEGGRFLATRRVAMNADEVGFGKTGQVVHGCDLATARRITYVCGSTLAPQQVVEFQRWSMWGYDTHIVCDGDDKIPQRDGVVFVSYGLARSPKIKSQLLKRGCDVLTIDEAHRLNGGGKTTTAVLGKGGLQKTASRVWWLTGEPAPNGAHEYYVFLKFAGAFPGRYEEFIRRYCIVVETSFGPKVVGSRNDTREELKALLRPYVIQRSGAEAARAPLTVDELPITGAAPAADLDPATQQRILAAAQAGDWNMLDDPSVSTVRRLAGTVKAQPVANMAASELSSGPGKMLVFAAHTDVIDILSARLAPFGCGVIDGRASDKQRATIIKSFQHDPSGLRVIVAHSKSAGEGLTLTAATRVILAEPAWTPAENHQCIARAWRRGQTQPVRASFMYLPGSIDQAIAGILARKARDRASLRLQPVVA